MSHKDEATREALASELGELKDKYSKLEHDYNELKHQSSQVQALGLGQTQGQQTFQPQHEQLKNNFYNEANLEVASELGHS
ncbi:hypothetical protein [Desulfosporosinus sp. BG]|uniref:hypothetical protein n=1 Tax=Desulfosporosinus sp. BG TaxID=1633135 RepID=UPI00083B6387|nr:hypothetical protein [Desulfosporosinus sp. BG]ODA41305.1 hypothetical protein DSBG_1915 [Desulfosporosinus sp. BG]